MKALKHLILFTLISINLQAQEAKPNQMESVLCLPMIGQTAQLAHGVGSMSYKLPIFSEELDAKAIEYLELVKSKKVDPESPELQTQAAITYTEIAAVNPSMAKLCSEFSAVLTGDCLSKENVVECINQRGNSAEIREAAKTFATKMQDLLLVRTEMKVATDIMLPLSESLAEKEEKMKSSIAQFIFNNYIKIIVGLWIFIIAMVAITLSRLMKRK